MANVNLLHFSDLLQTTTSSFLRKDSQLELSINVHGDQIGSLTKRLGYAQVGSTLSSDNTVRGAYSYSRQADGTQYLYAVCNGTLSYFNGTTITGVTSGINTSALEEFRVFVDQLFMVGADSSNNFITPANVSGTTYTTTTNLSGAPTGARFVEVYKNQLYFADCLVSGIRYPSRFYRSSVPSITGALSWSASDYEEVYTDNGEPLKGMHTNRALNQLLFFKETSLHAWDTFRIRDVGSVGTTSHRSIQTIANVTFFFNEKGIFSYTGSEPKLISRSIEKWINGISSPTTVFAVGYDNRYYKLNVGTITVDGVSYSNCEIVYSVLDNTFTIYSYAHTFSIYALHKLSGVIRVYSGDTTGKLFKLAAKNDEVYSDDGTAISAQFTTKALDLGVPGNRKFVDKVIIYTTRGQNLSGRMRVRGRDWSTNFKINDTEQEEGVNPEDGRFVQFNFSESSTIAPFIFEGLSFNVQETTSNYA